MRSRLIAFTALVFAGLLCASSLRAQEKSPPPPPVPRHLAIEIVGHDYGMPFPVLEAPSEGGYLETDPPKHLSNWKQPPGALPLTRVRIRTTLEGEGVRIKVGAVFDDSELPDESGPKYGEKEEALASYFAREGESIKVGELARFGFEPMALKVVRDLPRQDKPEAVVIQPQIVNPLQSVTVMSFESDPQQSTFYRLTLRNLSAKNIVALEVHTSDGHSQREEGMPDRPLMTPGATYQTSISVGGEWLTPPQGFVPDTEQQTLQVGTVVFDDDTYEGASVIAAEFAANREGRRIQLSRVIKIFQNMLDAPEQDANATLAKLKAQISTLRIDVDASTIDSLLARFPKLSSKDDKAWFKSTVMTGLKRGREETLFRLKDLEEARTRNAENFNFQQSLRAINQQLARRIGSR